MIGWILSSWIGQVAFVVFAIWFARGLWKAAMRPRLTLVDVGERLDHHGTFVTVNRLEYLPPWRTFKGEVWLLYSDYALRESDGLKVDGYSTMWSGVVQELRALVEVRRARDFETEKLTKDERRPN